MTASVPPVMPTSTAIGAARNRPRRKEGRAGRGMGGGFRERVEWCRTGREEGPCRRPVDPLACGVPHARGARAGRTARRGRCGVEAGAGGAGGAGAWCPPGAWPGPDGRCRGPIGSEAREGE
ncbi:hypothetical protein GCM10010393_23360 [Streptomyces gobitricini]|uniref:Uncharacterized protein n=1 Tax=Streptomyces gobitricini TaxID=68211 RepID=A0ABP5Z1R8_9ACTN